MHRLQKAMVGNGDSGAATPRAKLASRNKTKSTKEEEKKDQQNGPSRMPRKPRGSNRPAQGRFLLKSNLPRCLISKEIENPPIAF